MNQQGVPVTKKSIFKRWWFWVIVIIVILVTALTFGKNLFENYMANKGQGDKQSNNQTDQVKNEFEWPDPNAKTITAVPLDLTQIESFSKFRSCGGHDRAGYNFQKVLEADRSMKHMYGIMPEFRGTMDKVKIFAPFDGTIIWLQKVNPEDTLIEESYLRKDGKIDKFTTNRPAEQLVRLNPGTDMGLASPLDENAQMNLNHMQPIRAFKVGDKVKAGELLGYASLGSVENDADFDYVGRERKREGENEIEILDSAFDHMTPQVLAEFAKYGITPENTKFTKEERDAKPCGYDAVTKYGASVCVGGTDNECWVKLKH